MMNVATTKEPMHKKNAVIPGVCQSVNVKPTAHINTIHKATQTIPNSSILEYL